jgi:hypothetical protein
MLQDFPADFSYYLGLQEMIPVGMADGYAQHDRAVGAQFVHAVERRLAGICAACQAFEQWRGPGERVVAPPLLAHD